MGHRRIRKEGKWNKQLYYVSSEMEAITVTMLKGNTSLGIGFELNHLV